MAIFPFFRHKSLLKEADQSLVVQAIREAELQTSGEIRVFIESRCKFVEPLDRAQELFGQLQMQKTQDRNAVLVYIALKDRQLALYADVGIHQKVGEKFWNDAVRQMLGHFNRRNYGQGTAEVVRQIGEALKVHFPYDKDNDRNELPDEIVFGK